MEDRTCRCGVTFTPTHGRQRCCTPACRQPNHAKVEKRCDWCGASCIKYRGQQRYRGTYCGRACRDAAIRSDGEGSCELPDDHWGRWFGASSEWPPAEPWRHLRSGLRAAVEDGDRPAIVAAIRAKSIVTDVGCWEWQGIIKGGYPEARVGRRTLAVHRVALEAHLGQPLGKQAAHHKCANSVCVNPEHLQPVTHAANAAEMLARTYMVSRIRDLEAALADANPNHPLLCEVGVA